jgi:REP element-mobilizing transposase RayT
MRLIDNYFSHYRVSIEAFCLMPNHYHMLVQQMEGGSISRFIQTTCNAYVQGFNVQMEHSGALFQGKAKALEVDNDEYAVRLCRYIHLNPVVAGLVSTPEQWEWSDYREWIDDRSNPPSDLRKVSELKPSDLPKVSLRDIYFESGKAYAEFVSLGQEEQELKKYMLE